MSTNSEVGWKDMRGSSNFINIIIVGFSAELSCQFYNISVYFYI